MRLAKPNFCLNPESGVGKSPLPVWEENSPWGVGKRPIAMDDHSSDSRF